ncbi:MAG: LpxD N-terminal domain-containing protein [Myxococcota bacterium]
METAANLARLVGGEVYGNDAIPIEGIADLQSAGPQHISFLANSKYQALFQQTQAGCVLVRETVSNPPCTLIRCADPYLAMATIAAHFHPPAIAELLSRPERMCILRHVSTGQRQCCLRRRRIDADVFVGAATVIGPTCYVGRAARIGHGTTLHPGAKVMERCIIGDRVILQPGCIVGGDGFGYAVDANGCRKKIPQVGIVVVEDDVEWQ